MEAESTESLLKSLKASNNVELAISAWVNENLYIPSKGQFLATWALNVLLKDNNAICDPRYWILLESILLGESLPPWLPTLVYKTPVIPILTALLRVSHVENGVKLHKETLEAGQRVLRVIAPLAYPKTRLETVLDCFWACLDATASARLQFDISELVKVATEGFRIAFGSATNKSKIYTNFVEGHFQAFCCSILNTDRRVDLKEVIWDAVKEVICSFEAIKTIAQQREAPNHGFFGYLRATAQSVPAALRLSSRLLVDQIAATRAHRHALSQANVELHAWESYTSFTSVFDLDTKEGALAQLNVLRTLETHVGGGIREQNWLNILHTTSLRCSQKVVLQGTQVTPEVRTSLSGSLTILGRMNYDLLSPNVVSLLEALAYLPSENTSGRELYRVIVTYHSKTRTMDALCGQLFDVVSRGHPPHDANPADKGTLFGLLNGCILGTEAGLILSLALKQYVTPGQVPRIVSLTLSALNEAGKCLKNDIESKSHRWKKGSPASFVAPPESESLAGSVALAFRLASFVLPALPATSLNHTPSQALDDWRSAIRGGPAMRSLKLALDSRYLQNWTFQLVGVSALRFISSLEGSPLSFEGFQALDSTGLASPEALLLSNIDILAELKIELIRLLLRSSTHDRLISVIQRALDYLNSTEAEVWDGNATAMTAGSLHTGLTLLLTDRWLRLLESHATDEQLRAFVSFITSSYKDHFLSEIHSPILPGILVHRMLRNGAFWELRSLISLILERTENAEIFSHGVHDQPKQPPIVDPPPQPVNIEDLGQYFQFLLYFPAEAFKGGVSALLARRAILTDIAASNHLDQSSRATMRTRASCRVFASRFMNDPKSSLTEYIGTKSVLQFLVATEPGLRSYPALVPTFLRATNALVDVAFSIFIRHIVQSNSDFEELYVLFFPLDNLSSLNSADSPHLELMARLLYNFAGWCQTSSLTQEQHHSIRGFTNRFQGTLQDFLLSNIAERPALLSPLLKLLRACLRFRHIDANSVRETIGDYIAATLSTIPSLRETSIVSDSLSELMWMLVDAGDFAPQRVDFATKMISLHSLASSHYGLDLDVPLQQGVRRMEPQTYEQVLEVLKGMLEADPVKSIIHTLTVVLIHSPEGTFKIAQTAFSDSLGVLNDIPVTTARMNVEAQRQILDHALSLCTDKPAFLRITDIGSILVLLAGYLQPSAQKGPQSYPDIFLSIINITSALVRHRRDLVLLNLPHLAAIFCLLLGCMTKARPHLGQKQRRNISNRLPHWLVLSQPLGSHAASLLSRLLVAMTTKTVLRSTKVNFASHEAGKDAQSLKKPFGKHASCVISAYIHLLNDPLCLLDRETRIELAPGLFALCGMLGEKGRDALMPTLDSGGKLVFKSLWSSYESQKYVGKG